MATVNGEVRFEADGAAHVLRFGINALCALEERLGMGVQDIGAAMEGNLQLRMLRSIFWAALGATGTEQAAGALMDAVGIERASALVVEAFAAAFPSAAAQAEAGAGDAESHP